MFPWISVADKDMKEISRIFWNLIKLTWWHNEASATSSGSNFWHFLYFIYVKLFINRHFAIHGPILFTVAPVESILTPAMLRHCESPLCSYVY